ncbi:hypothetical protein N431DRAFT_439861 [Stipitochalara longipes BDJ]|nr:hypothetical protein N431DRAFT_439861 [Stipitochalara longipes BDJ]
MDDKKNENMRRFLGKIFESSQRVEKKEGLRGGFQDIKRGREGLEEREERVERGDREEEMSERRESLSPFVDVRRMEVADGDVDSTKTPMKAPLESSGSRSEDGGGEGEGVSVAIDKQLRKAAKKKRRKEARLERQRLVLEGRALGLLERKREEENISKASLKGAGVFSMNRGNLLTPEERTLKRQAKRQRQRQRQRKQQVLAGQQA